MKNLVQNIKRKAVDIGFGDIAICDAEPLQPAGKLLQQWIDQRYHGTMTSMARTAWERANPRSFFPEAQSIIVTTLNYYRSGEPILRPPEQGNISLYARGRDYHKVMRKKLKELLSYIQSIAPEAKGRVCVDSFPLMEKPLAVKAGLGWIGKHTNLIIKQKGSYFFLGEILLSLPLPPDNSFTADHCGNCNRCQVACPTNALEQPYILDSRKCISYLTIEHHGAIDADLQKGMENWVFGCDICQAVCPWNRFSTPTGENDFHSRIPERWFSLHQQLAMSEDEFQTLFRGTPVKRAGYKNFIRNVKIASRNMKRRKMPYPIMKGK